MQEILRISSPDDVISKAEEVVVRYQTSLELKERVNNVLTDMRTNPFEQAFVLSNTGFDMQKQLEGWIDSIINNRECFSNAKFEAIQKTLEDVKGFYWEYLSRQLVLPIYISFDENETGQKRVIANKYGCEYLEVVSKDERQGAVYRSLQKVVQFLACAPSGSLAVFSSPPGWSGMKTSEGASIIYTETQTYVYRITQNGELDAITIRSGMDADENMRMLSFLKAQNGSKEGRKEPQTNTNERIMTIVEDVVFFEGGEELFDFETVVNAIAYAREGKPVITDEKGQRTFAELQEKIKRKDELVILDKKVQRIFDDLENSLRSTTDFSETSIRQIVKAIGTSILDLALELGHVPTCQQINTYAQRRLAWVYIQSIPGCAGGGAVRKSAVENSEKKFVLYCGFCGFPLFQSIEVGFKCPNCGGVYEGC